MLNVEEEETKEERYKITDSTWLGRKNSRQGMEKIVENIADIGLQAYRAVVILLLTSYASQISYLLTYEKYSIWSQI